MVQNPIKKQIKIDGNADKITNDRAIIANKFNSFFANVAPNLGQYSNSMFIVGTYKNEIINIVTVLKSKNSKKCNYRNSQSIIHYQWFIYNRNIL